MNDLRNISIALDSSRPSVVIFPFGDAILEAFETPAGIWVEVGRLCRLIGLPEHEYGDLTLVERHEVQSKRLGFEVEAVSLNNMKAWFKSVARAVPDSSLHVLDFCDEYLELNLTRYFELGSLWGNYSGPDEMYVALLSASAEDAGGVIREACGLSDTRGIELRDKAISNLACDLSALRCMLACYESSHDPILLSELKESLEGLYIRAKASKELYGYFDYADEVSDMLVSQAS